MIKSQIKSELFFGIVAKIGTDIESAIQVLQDELEDYGYNPVVVKVTEALSQSNVRKFITKPIDKQSLETRYNTSIEACNELRSKLGNDVMAKLAINQIITVRSKNLKEKPTAYIIRQIKRTEEIDILRSTYDDKFVLLSCYSPTSLRREFLSKKIAESHHDINQNAYTSKASELIIIDENEDGNKFGQRVREAFPEGDVIVNSTTKQSAEKTVKHFLEVFFGNPEVSPSNDEYGIYMAFSAALRSTDLSRQVGAAIFSDKLEIISLGCNEVPKFSGGTYLQDDTDASGEDGRDSAVGYDANAQIKMHIARDAVKQISKIVGNELELKDENNKINLDKMLNDEFVDELIKKHVENKAGDLRELLLMDITEFGRAVHAEMNALTDAARLGKATKFATLYCTTFPCHNCAKHIVASGIHRVVYIQPYPKSRTDRLYPDSIAIDPKHKPNDKVIFESHTGIGPNIYSRIFKRNKMKDAAGNVLRWNKQNAHPKVSILNIGYITNEAVQNGELAKSLKSLSDNKS
ncbi:anti-phage dCTP deaminase [Litorimonas sp. WD9-15]|uniref:anti-phage dCTP deaminase n=1 Tax=Litorimonas sp. WD9-15 TaxID=3418716 RepID=UPI003D06831F